MCFRHASGLCPKWKRNCLLAFLDREEPNREKPKKRKSLFISESHVFWKSSKLILPLTYKFISMSSHFNYQAILFVNHHPTYWPWGCAWDWVGFASKCIIGLFWEMLFFEKMKLAWTSISSKLGKFSCCVPGCTNNWRNSPNMNFTLYQAIPK